MEWTIIKVDPDDTVWQLRPLDDRSKIYFRTDRCDEDEARWRYRDRVIREYGRRAIWFGDLFLDPFMAEFRISHMLIAEQYNFDLEVEEEYQRLLKEGHPERAEKIYEMARAMWAPKEWDEIPCKRWEKPKPKPKFATPEQERGWRVYGGMIKQFREGRENWKKLLGGAG